MTDKKKQPDSKPAKQPQPAAGKKKPNTKVLKNKRRQRRQLLTFMRMIRYGTNNFTRNAWLTIAATAVMTITLLIIFVTAMAGNVLNDSIKEMTRSIDLSIYIKTDTDEQDVEAMISDLGKLDNVDSVTYISPEEGKQSLARENVSDSTAMDALTQATNRIPGTIRVQLIDVEDTSSLEDYVANNELYRANQDRRPSFVTKKDIIDRLTSWAGFAQTGGIVASSIFVIISSLIIFNTIRMAIFSRKDEIEMMKLIGADRNFIRGPFVVEAIVYGLIAAVIATAIGIGLLLWSKDGLVSFGVMVEPTFDLIVKYIGFVVLAMILAGGIIGTISSLLATRRYLKV